MCFHYCTYIKVFQTSNNNQFEFKVFLFNKTYSPFVRQIKNPLYYDKAKRNTNIEVLSNQRVIHLKMVYIIAVLNESLKIFTARRMNLQ